jgi:hypothetical protein
MISNSSLSMNITNQSGDDNTHLYSNIFEKIAFPFIIIVGTICNILTFLVMRQKRMRHQSTYFYMAVLAIADEFVLLIGCLNFWLYLAFDINITGLSAVACKLLCIGLYSTFHFSVWLVTLLSC